MDNEKVVCHTPTQGKRPTRILKWKYDTVKAAIMSVLPKSGEGVLFKELPTLVGEALSDDIKEELGSLNWYTTSVKLDMEVRGEIVRVGGRGAQRLLLSK